ncbi:MAG: cytochrome o ubiquinol oxidase subunit IV [Pseudolabrys sp.]
MFAALPVTLAYLFGGAPARSEPGRNEQEEYRRDLRSYLWGIGLALALTAVPFAMVNWSAAPQFWLFVAIGTCALVQVVVHFRFFLHVDFSQQKREDLHLILFSTLILTTMIGGTIWILTNLAVRMH